MPNGRKEPWEQLGYIADIGSRVVTKDPLSSLMEPGSPFWQWINNETAYAKAEDAVDTAHQNTMERDRADSKDAMKLQKVRGTQSMAELAEQHANAEELALRDIFMTNLDTMRAQSELDPHGASSRAEAMLLDPKFPDEMRSLLQSSSTLFKQKAERKDQRVALAEEMHPYASVESASQYTQKQFMAKLTEKFSDGTSKFTVAEQNFYLGQRDTALQKQGATKPFQQRLVADLSAEFFDATTNLSNMALAPTGTFTKEDITTAQNTKDALRNQLDQAIAGRFEDVDPKHASTAKIYEGLVLGAGLDLDTIAEKHPKEHEKLILRASEIYRKEQGLDKEEVTPLRIEEIREKEISIKAGDRVTLKNYNTGEVRANVEGKEANQMLKRKEWDLVKITSTALPPARIPLTGRIRTTTREQAFPWQALPAVGAIAEFPRNIKEGFILQDSKKIEYEIVRVFKDENGVQKAVLKNRETGERLTKPLTYAEVVAQYTGVGPAIE